MEADPTLGSILSGEDLQHCRGGAHLCTYLQITATQTFCTKIFDVYIALVLVYFMRIFPDYILMSNAELTFNTTNATSRNKPLNID